jgi:hypothetical protein
MLTAYTVSVTGSTATLLTGGQREAYSPSLP